MDPKHQRAFTGRGGQMAVIAELLMRGCNAAIPEVDVGQDVFAFQDDQPVVDRIQVKTANAEPFKGKEGYAADFSVPLRQLRAISLWELYYLFAVRLDGRWTDYLVISRSVLKAMQVNEAVGYVNDASGELQLHVSFGPAGVICSGKELTAYRNAWHDLPALSPPRQLPGQS